MGDADVLEYENYMMDFIGYDDDDDVPVGVTGESTGEMDDVVGIQETVFQHTWADQQRTSDIDLDFGTFIDMNGVVGTELEKLAKLEQKTKDIETRQRIKAAAIMYSWDVTKEQRSFVVKLMTDHYDKINWLNMKTFIVAALYLMKFPGKYDEISPQEFKKFYASYQGEMSEFDLIRYIRFLALYKK